MPVWTEEQKQAISLEGKNIIVSAGAGSGKTAVLTNRVLRKLKSGVSIQQLLILTFTNKAASEMRERIKKIVEEENLKEQLDYLDSAFITTFDSFTLFLVKKYHYLLSIPKNISIADSTVMDLRKKEILDQIFLSFYKEKDEKFEKLISDFCVKDDQEIKDAILTIYQKITMKPNYLEYIDNYMDNFYNEEHIENVIQEYEELLKNKKIYIEEILEELKYLATGEYYYQIVDTLKNFVEAKTYEEIKACFPLKLPMVPRNSEKELIEKKEELVKALAVIGNYIPYDNLEQIKESLYKTKDYVSVFLQLIQKLDEQLLNMKRQQNIYEFQDIALMGLSLLKKFPMIQEELKKQFQEIMIDEYQDTNDLQEAFIKQISSHNVYMVGDIKQSIYRFRNANPQIFKNKYDQYAKKKDGIKIDLNKNFRSRKEVIEDINTLFNMLMDDEIGGANYEIEHQMIFGNMTYESEENNQNHHLELYEYPKDDAKGYKKEEIEAFLIANDIEKRIKEKESVLDKDTGKLKTVNYNDFVILMDRTTDFTLYKKIFEYKKIPLSIEKDESITEEKDIIVLKNLYHLIIEMKNHPFSKSFRYYFFSIGRSFLFSYKDQELFDMFLKEDFKDNELYKKVQKVSEKILGLTSYEILQMILEEFSFYEKLITIGDISESFVRISYFLELAQNLAIQGYDPLLFDEHLKKIDQSKFEIRISLNKESQNSVKIMTIHKSKGLEYPICYYAGIYKEFNQADLKEKFLYDSKYGIITPYFEEGICTTIYKELVKDTYQKEEISEKLRLFYVALTRSREKMILVLPKLEETSPFKKGARLRCHSFLDFLKIISEKLEHYQKSFEIEKLNLSKEYLNFTQETEEIESNLKTIKVKEWKKEVDYIEEKSFSKSGKELLKKEELEFIELGKWFHEQFEYIDFKNPQIEDLPLSKKDKEYLYRFFEQPIIKEGNFKNVLQEHEFIYKDENKKYHGVIDLVIEKETEVIIIDYKLKNIIDEAYKNQLFGYKKYLESKFKKPVITYLYSILTNQMVEI